MAIITILKKDGKNENIEVIESVEDVVVVANGDEEVPYNRRSDFIILTKVDGSKVSVNKRYIAYVK
jgi:hypothetical protein